MRLWAAKRLITAVSAIFLMAGCALGPRMVELNRIKYNESVKVTSERQLLLNIVRLRYVDSPSSLSVTTIAEQPEIAASLQALPFFTSSAAGQAFGGYAGTILPQAQLSGAVRPTLSYAPMDDQEFTRKLFTPISLEGVAYVGRTTWPLSTVCRLYLENLNWVPNAETGSGPVPRRAPEFEAFVSGMEALVRLEEDRKVVLFSEEREETVTDPVPAGPGSASAAVETVKAGYEYRRHADGGWVVTRKKKVPVLRAGNFAEDDPDWAVFCRAFRLDPSCRAFDITTDQLDPFLPDGKGDGLRLLDMETRSLIQVLFFLSQGVDVPGEDIVAGRAPFTTLDDGRPFDWQQVLGGLFKVKCSKGKKPPAGAHVAVEHKGAWFYIEESDSASKSTFHLVMELSRLEVGVRTGQSAPILTLPLNGR